MRYPDFTADIISHTDTRGNPTRNLNVSKERANNAVAYLVYRGIPEGRLKAVGKGGQEPRNQCKPGTNCSEEEHRTNVRFEVKIHAAQP
jgi:outer membrane protein OmpA-like peptidoglycan-associated protein